MEPVLLRIHEAAALLKVSKWTVYRWIEEGRLRATKIGRGSLRVFQTSARGLIEEAQLDHGEAQNNSPKNATPVRATSRKKVRSDKKQV